MADPTPTDIFAPSTSDEIKEALRSLLQKIPGFPIDDWSSGGEMRTLLELETLTEADLLQLALPGMAGQAALDFAGEAENLTQTARQLFNLLRVGAVSAVQNETLSCDASHGPYTIVAGGLWFQGATGNRWVNITGGTLPSNGSLVVQIQAEGPGARYNDPAGTVKTMLTSLLGVTAINTATDFGPVTVGLLSPGTIAASRTAPLVAPKATTFIIRIDSSGQVAAGAWSYSADGGKTFVSVGAIATTALLMADGVTSSGTTVTFTNHASVTPSFVAGDQFVFTTPGSSFVAVGKDVESGSTLIARCKARWPDLSLVRTQSRYAKWAKAASAEVTRVRIEEDATYLGRLYLTLAGIAGGVTGGAVTAVQTYVDPRAPIGRIIVAQTATTQQITGSGVVTVAAAQLAAVQAAAQILWQAVLLAADIGGIMRVADLVRAVMDAGAIDFTGAQLNGGGNVVLASTKVAILNTTTPLLATQLTWQAV